MDIAELVDALTSIEGALRRRSFDAIAEACSRVRGVLGVLPQAILNEAGLSGTLGEVVG